MKIGLILGSFDPLHIGHLAMATEALNAGYVDRVEFIVAKQNVWKINSTPYEIRLKLAEKAVEEIPGCFISNVERDSSEPCFAYKGLEKIKKLYSNDELYIIGGSDMFASIDKWSHFDWIKENFKFIGAIRDRQAFAVRVDACIDPCINISSTKVRQLIRDNKIAQPWISLDLEDLIYKYGLYK